jgi:hypothetical protein
LISLLLSPSMTFLFPPILKDSYWTFDTSIGKFWEPSLCYHEVCVLDVGSDLLWFTCTCWKMSPWIRVEFPLFFSGIIVSRSGMCEVFLRWKVVTSIPWNIPLCTLSYWLVCSKKRSSWRASISSLMSPSGLTCVTLQIHMHAIAFGSRIHMCYAI